jgi:uncharacterized protein YfdQ (DUF2303 family)
MDATAINAVRDLATAATTNNYIAHPGQAPIALIPVGFELKSLEQYQPQPDRFRGVFSTRIIGEFIDYINDHADSNSSVFIDPVEMSAAAILDMGDKDDPHWGQHKTQLVLKRIPEFYSLINRDGYSFDQQDFIDFAEDWQESIVFYDSDGTDLGFKSAINAIRRITVSAVSTQESEVNQFNQSHSSMDAIEVSSKNAVIPTGFTFSCVPYDDFDHVQFNCQLRPLTTGRVVAVKYRIIGLDNKINQIADEFKCILHQSIITNSISMYTGIMAYQK